MIVGGLNIFIDPNMFFNHQNSFNQKQGSKNERYEKLNRFLYSKQQFDSLLLGSSLCTYINQNHFTKYKVFNFSASAMRPEEFPEYIKIFKEKYPHPKAIILGFDFLEYFQNSYGPDDINKLFNDSKSPFYELEKLFNISSLESSFRTLYYNLRTISGRYYTRDNVAFIERRSVGEVEALIEKSLKDSDFSELKVDSKFQEHLDQIKAAAGETPIIVFTTPISHFRLELFKKRGWEMKAWLEILQKNFGHVYHFSSINSVTLNHQEYFSDSYHFYPEVGDMVIQYIESEGSESTSDFGETL